MPTRPPKSIDIRPTRITMTQTQIFWIIIGVILTVGGIAITIPGSLLIMAGGAYILGAGGAFIYVLWLIAGSFASK